MMSDASEMLAAALEQMDDIIAGRTSFAVVLGGIVFQAWEDTVKLPWGLEESI